MQINKNHIWYILGSIVALVVFGIDKIYFLFMLAGVGLGLVLHTWVKGILDNMTNVFFTNESLKREMRKKELENELQKINESEKD